MYVFVYSEIKSACYPNTSATKFLVCFTDIYLGLLCISPNTRCCLFSGSALTCLKFLNIILLKKKKKKEVNT